jgi:hypothetical protein
MSEEGVRPAIDYSRYITLARRLPPPCPLCKGPTTERAEPDPETGGPSFWCRKKFCFDCAHCAQSWECCGICHRGALVEGTLCGDVDIRKIECKGGCGWAVAWRADCKCTVL